MATRARGYRLLLLGLAMVALVSACSTARSGSPTRPRQSSTPASRPPAGGAADGRLRDLLEQALDATANVESLQLGVDCREGSRLRSLQVFGGGVGILDDRVQIRLSRREIDALVRLLMAAGFPELRETYGEAEADAVTMMTCRVEVALGGIVKEVVQLVEGEQSPALAKLARDLLATCEPAARDGVTAASLRDGLQKIARGELAPESWGVTLQRRVEEGEGRPPGRGYLLAIAARSASSRELGASTGDGERREMALPDGEIRALAGELAAADLAAWPANLWSRDYVDLAVHVLQHEKSVQARQFAGLDPGARPTAQRELDEMLQVLERLHGRVVDEGTPAAQPR